MLLGLLTNFYFSFQQDLPKNPPVQLAEDTEGGEDQDNQEEWADALPSLEINPQDLGKGEGGSDTTDPLEPEELLDEEEPEDDLEEADSAKTRAEGLDYPATGLRSGTDSDTSSNSSGEVYSPKVKSPVLANQGKQ